MKLTAADIFYVITGFTVPKDILPDSMREKRLEPTEIIEFFANEKVYCFQIERIRQESKCWLLKKHNFLLAWNLSDEVLKTPGGIEFFFKNYALKHPYLEIEPLPNEFHLSMNSIEEREFLKLTIEMRGLFSFK